MSDKSQTGLKWISNAYKVSTISVSEIVSMCKVRLLGKAYAKGHNKMHSETANRDWRVLDASIRKPWT